MNTSHIESLEQAVWGQLNKGVWPVALLEIKPKKWDGADLNVKGRLVLDHLGQIIYKVTQLTNQQHMTHQACSRVQPRQKPSFNIGQNFTYSI